MNKNRPLSPHLQVYRWQISMALSILHRASGVALMLGTLMFAYWFIAIASGQEYYEYAQNLIGSIFGRLILLGFTIALVIHFLNGIRHLFYDAGLGFKLETSRITGWLVVTGTILITIIIWISAYLIGGMI